MAKFFRAVSLLLTVILILSVASCGESSKEKETETKNEAETEASESLTETETDKKKETETVVYQKDAELKVMSQNMRTLNDANGNSIEERSKRFKVMIAEKQPDIIGTQETNQTWTEILKTMTEYVCIGDSREGRGEAKGERNAVLYRRDRFKHIRSKTFWLTPTPDVAGKIPESGYRRICTWAALFDKITGETLLVVNTHLDTANNDVRLEQIGYLFKELDSVIVSLKTVESVYFTGDFNCSVNTAPYKAILEYGFTDARRATENDISVKSGTQNSYDAERPGYEIDFCFFIGEKTVVSYEIISKLYKGEGEEAEGFVSDHYAVMAVFKSSLTG